MRIWPVIALLLASPFAAAGQALLTLEAIEIAPIMRGQSPQTQLAADLASLERRLVATLARDYAANTCGDTFTAANVALDGGEGTRAELSADLTMTRWQCVKFTEPVCRGFKCETVTRTRRNMIYHATFPLKLDVVPFILPGTSEARFQIRAPADSQVTEGLHKALLGQADFYREANAAFIHAAGENLDQIVDELLAQLPGARKKVHSAKFFTRPDGGLNLVLTATSSP